MNTRALATFSVLWLATLGGCAEAATAPQNDPPPNQPPPPTLPPAAPSDTVWKGFGLSPRGFPADFSNIVAFFDEVGGLEAGSVMQNGPWRDDLVGGTDSGEIPVPFQLVYNSAATYGYGPVAVFGWRNESGNFLSLPGDPTNDWSNATAKAAFSDMLVAFVTQYSPAIIFLGNESDFYYEADPLDYTRWVSAYEEFYAAIKQASPTTQVGPVFNYEHLSGSGGLNGWSTSYWEALEAHDLASVDVLGLTLYPFFGFAEPDQIPDDYLDPLLARIGNTPLAITETGWPAEDLVAGPLAWTPSAQNQVAYLDRLEGVLAGIDLELVNWLFLHPIDVTSTSPLGHELFGSVSLRDVAGAERPVYARWRTFDPPFSP